MRVRRVLYLIGQLGVGGSERQLYYLLQAIDRHRYRPAVAVWNCRDVHPFGQKIEDLDVPVYSFSDISTRQGKLLSFRRLVRKLSPELVHSYSFYTNFAAWWCTVGTDSIAVGSIRNNFISERREAGNIVGRLSARWPADQICNSLAAKQLAQLTLGPFKTSRLHVVRNGLDVQSFRPVASPPERPMLLAVGRFYAEKRWDRLIRLIALARQRGITFSVRHAGEGPLRQVIQAQAKHLAVDHMIEFLGSRQDVPQLLADSMFLVHTADEEGCPNVVMEAMACGRPVVATNAGDIPDLIDEGKTGFVVDRGNDEMFLERIAQLIRDRDLCRSMGKAARAKAERQFGLDRLVSETLSAYRAIGWRDS